MKYRRYVPRYRPDAAPPSPEKVSAFVTAYLAAWDLSRRTGRAIPIAGGHVKAVSRKELAKFDEAE